MRGKLLIASALALSAFASPAMAAPFIVDAAANSSNGGTALDTGIVLTAGSVFTVSSSLNDLWSSGALPRWSDANGIVPRVATALDDSGQAPGTVIGVDHGFWDEHGVSARYGSLVGRINGVYQLIGANNTLAAWESGTLELFYWDSNNFDNEGAITFDVASAVPEPATWALMLVGFGLIGGAVRSSRRNRTSAIGTVKVA